MIALGCFTNQALIEFISTELKPRYKLGLLSNTSPEWMREFLTKNQLQGLFDTVVISGEEGIVKPSPVIFERTVERIGLAPGECIMIDDIEENCESAEGIGMKSLLYTSNEHLLTALKELT